ncbi:MAG: transcriptional repressor [Pseudonocardia sp.]|nr:transcriptional repressor [Pseudonocardia sp.]
MNPAAVRPEAALRERGLRATRPRVAVLGALTELGGHRSAEEVRVRIAGTAEPLPRSSVYGILDALVRAGLVMTADAGPGVVLYEIADRWHHHFVCRICQGVTDVDCVVGTKPCLIPGLDAAVGTVDEAQVIFRGVCAPCASAPPA